jgi:hypothetical protein
MPILKKVAAFRRQATENGEKLQKKVATFRQFFEKRLLFCNLFFTFRRGAATFRQFFFFKITA